jgi:formamidopyrimidine-DNA glycosylase
MPELPEVETIRLQLERFLVGSPRGKALRGHKIKAVDIRWPKIFEGDKNKAMGTRILGIRRFGKVLVMDLDNDYSLVIQVKLTGQLIYQGPNLTPKGKISQKVFGGLGGKHTHVVFDLDQNGKLYYNDVRKFGRIKVVETKDVKNSGLIGKLGPEPHVAKGFAGRKTLTLKIFREILSKTKRPIKIVLMDQGKMSGVGNIYANDALYLAGINPKKPANSLSKTEQLKLFKSVIKVLKEGIKREGASELAYVTPDGKEGKYQDFTLVYGREGEECGRCVAKIKKIQLGGRGTYFCPRCQK